MGRERLTGTVFQCVPNFSEGRNRATVERIADAIRSVPEARLIDYSADPDHNRSVMTILGSGPAVAASLILAARVAVRCIDMRVHSGVHPRTGAIDVVPVVPLRGATRLDAAELAATMGAALAKDLDLPVYFYEGNSGPERPGALPHLRRGAFEAIRDLDLIGLRAPDLGPSIAHFTAGIAIVGARGPLVAYNVNLGSDDLTIAVAIARRIRAERERLPELRGVRALGVWLATQRRCQVTMNLTRPAKTPLPGVFAFVAHEAARFGVTDLESEIIGAIPIESLGGEPPESIRWDAYDEARILESWLPE